MRKVFVNNAGSDFSRLGLCNRYDFKDISFMATSLAMILPSMLGADLGVCLNRAGHPLGGGQALFFAQAPERSARTGPALPSRGALAQGMGRGQGEEASETRIEGLRQQVVTYSCGTLAWSWRTSRYGRERNRQSRSRSCDPPECARETPLRSTGVPEPMAQFFHVFIMV
jgi:hypothetical protein